MNATFSAPLVRAYAFRGAPPSPSSAETACAQGPLQLLLINLANDTQATVQLPAAAPSAFAAAPSGCVMWTLGSAGGLGEPFATAASLNGLLLASTVDASSVDPATFLGRIVQPATEGGQTAMLHALSVSFLCYR